MKRRFTILNAALALLTFLAVPMGMRGQSTVTFDASTDITANAQSYQTTELTINAADGSTWKATGYGATAHTNIIIGKGGANYLRTPIVDGTISSVAVTWSGNTKYYLALQTTTGTELEAKQNPSTSTTETFSVSGEYSQLQLVGRRSSGTDNAAATITKVVVTYTSGGGGSQAVTTTTTIDASGITNTDANISTAAGSLSATVSANNTPIEGATVTWSGNNDAVATIDSDGVVTLVGAGTVTFTAAYAGVSGTYQPSSDTYQMTVTYQPTTIEITPNYTFWGQNAQFSGTTCPYLEGTKDNVSLEWESGNQGNTYANQNAMRFYPKNTLTFTAPTGYEIKSITLTISGTYSDLTFNPTGFSGTTWTGASNSVEMSRPSTGSSYATISKFTIIIGLPSSVATPTFNPEAGTYNEAQSVIISCETQGATIYYTTDGTVPTNANTQYSSAIIVAETTTIKAIAYDGTDYSDVATANYIINLPLSTMDQIYAKASENNGAEKSAVIVFNDWIVTGVGSNAKRAFVSDGTKGFIIYNSNGGLTFERGQVLSGQKDCQVQLLNGAPCVTGLNASDFVITQTGQEPIVTTTTIDALIANNTGAVVDLGVLTWTGSAFRDSNNNEITYYNTIYSQSFTADKTYNVKGVFVYYGGNSNPKEIAPRDADDIVEVVITDPYITIESDAFELTADEEEGYLEITYGNFTPISFDIMYCDANGNELSEDPEWITLAIETPAGEEGDFVYYDVEPNDGAARTAYFKVYASLGEGLGTVYSNLVTVTQAEFVPDYVVLPFNWEGGTKEELTALNGVTGFGLGSNYAETNAPYRVRFDNQGDYILVKTDSQPGKVTIGIKNYGSSTGTVIAVQESSNGIEFTEVQELTITCAQNKTQILETTNGFASSTRYVRLYEKHFSANFGVGPITISGLETFTKDIVGNTWYFISSPTGTAPTNLNVLSDLYYYDEQDHYWRNKKNAANANGFDFGYGKGYLCANADPTLQTTPETVTLSFTGDLLTGDTYSVPVTYNTTTSEGDNNTLAGWNLVGNPFNSNATLNMDCYTISGNAINMTAQSAGTYTVAPCTGVMVKATGANQVIFTKASQGQASQLNQLEMTVAQQVMSRGTATSLVHDNAIVNFNAGSQLEKFPFNADAAELYIPQDGKDYAIVSSEAQGEMPVNFKAKENGTYTLSINPEGVEMNYLHLIDNKTGNDIDLLQTPSYSFEAKTTDYESRFKLVFVANNEDSVSAGSETFAFFSNGSFVINNPSTGSGPATLQVIDITGRIVKSESINGCANVNVNAAPGVYMLRLVNGDNVKVQKVVVK